MKKHLHCLLDTLGQYYDIQTVGNGELYFSMSLKWNYDQEYVNISMPNYVHKNLIKYKLEKQKNQFCLIGPAPRECGREASEVQDQNESPPTSEDKKQCATSFGKFSLL